MSGKVKVFVLSWNMGNAPFNLAQQKENLNNLNLNFEISKCLDKYNVQHGYDLICIGLQESTYVSTENKIYLSGDCYEVIKSSLQDILGEKFYMVRTGSRWGDW